MVLRRKYITLIIDIIDIIGVKSLSKITQNCATSLTDDSKLFSRLQNELEKPLGLSDSSCSCQNCGLVRRGHGVAHDAHVHRVCSLLPSLQHQVLITPVEYLLYYAIEQLNIMHHLMIRL